MSEFVVFPPFSIAHVLLKSADAADRVLVVRAPERMRFHAISMAQHKLDPVSLDLSAIADDAFVEERLDEYVRIYGELLPQFKRWERPDQILIGGLWIDDVEATLNAERIRREGGNSYWAIPHGSYAVMMDPIEGSNIKIALRHRGYEPRQVVAYAALSGNPVRVASEDQDA